MRPIVLFLDSRTMGGIETHVFNLATALDNTGLAVSVVFWDRYWKDSDQKQTHPLWQSLKNSNISTHSAEGRLFGLFRLIPKGALVHSHGYKANLINKLFSLRGRWTALPTHHNGDTGTGMLRYYVQADELTSRWFSPLSVSAEIHQRLSCKGLLIPNFVELNPLGIQSTGTTSATDKAGGNTAAQAHSKPVTQRLDYDRKPVTEEKLRVAFVGRLSPEKGPDTFCQLAETMSTTSQVEPATFQVYGDGPLLPPLKSRFNTVIFHGQKHMKDQWHNISILCITSQFEGLPLAALEAMSHGIPVCSFALGDLPALIEHGKNGWVVPPGDTEAMTCCLKQWLQMPAELRQQMASCAYQTIEENYSVKAVLPKIINHYHQLAA